MRAVLRRAKAKIQSLRSANRPGPFVIAANDLGIFCIPRNALHRPACRAVMRGEVWEAETLQFLVDNAAGDIVHGGTFFGDFLPALSRAYARVWAFEPSAESFKCAELTIKLNELANVELRNSGIGAASGLANLVTEQAGLSLGGGSYIDKGPGKIPIERIDDIIPVDRHVGVIHLDVEGYESEALKGAQETIRRCQPVIVLETLPGPIEGYAERMRLNENHVMVPVR